MNSQDRSNGLTGPINLKFNYEDKSLEELKELRKYFNLKEVRQEHLGEAYIIRMIDILLEKVERLENDNQ